jgi:hypothetical protein
MWLARRYGGDGTDAEHAEQEAELFRIEREHPSLRTGWGDEHIISRIVEAQDARYAAPQRHMPLHIEKSIRRRDSPNLEHCCT